MKKNPFLKVEELILKKVYGNQALLRLDIQTREYIPESGDIVTEHALREFPVYISSPAEIALAAVDGKNYLRGDMNCSVSLYALQEIIAQVPERSVETPSFGLDVKSDLLLFNNATYRITKVLPKKFYAGTPSVIRIYLRAL